MAQNLRSCDVTTRIGSFEFVRCSVFTLLHIVCQHILISNEYHTTNGIYIYIYEVGCRIRRRLNCKFMTKLSITCTVSVFKVLHTRMLNFISNDMVARIRKIYPIITNQ